MYLVILYLSPCDVLKPLINRDSVQRASDSIQVFGCVNADDRHVCRLDPNFGAMFERARLLQILKQFEGEGFMRKSFEEVAAIPVEPNVTEKARAIRLLLQDALSVGFGIPLSRI